MMMSLASWQPLNSTCVKFDNDVQELDAWHDSHDDAPVAVANEPESQNLHEVAATFLANVPALQFVHVVEP